MFSRYGKMGGFKSDYIVFCRMIRWIPFTVTVSELGKVGTIAEVLNIYDNFVKDELRDDYIEQVMRSTVLPVVVDCGINVGVTVRWWLHLNPDTRVFGIDMMAEAHEFTYKRLGPLKLDKQYSGITAIVSEKNDEYAVVNFTDPLDGSNSVQNPSVQAGGTRSVKMESLDRIIKQNNITSIDLLKIDIEGYGAKAIAGALEMLAITKNIILEIHSEPELAISAKLLHEAGFIARKFNSRNIWFTKDEFWGT